MSFQSPAVTPTPPPAPSLGLPITDRQRAERFADWLDESFHYIYSWQEWVYWDDDGWYIDESGKIGVVLKRKAIEFSEVMMEEARGYPPGAAQAAAIGIATKMQSNETMNAMIATYMAFQGVMKKPDSFDNNPYMLAVKNGVVDLRTGQFRVMEKNDMMLKKANVEFDPEAECPMWLEFLDQVQDKEDVKTYLQRAIGYTLTGITTEQVLFFLHGLGQNGKNTFVDIISDIMGDYTWTAPATLFLETKADDNKMNMQAQLPERRFVVGEEMPETARLAEARLKDLTGNDRITGRKLFCEPFNYKPTHKLWFFGNHKPAIHGSDDGIWRRLNMIPFDIKISEEKRDRGILKRLLTERAGILNWAIAGCLEWQKQGLNPPEAVRVATEDYRDEEDMIKQFVEEACILGPLTKIPKGILSSAFELWMRERGYKFSPSPRSVNDRVKRLAGVRSVKIGGMMHWTGVQLKDPAAFKV